MKSILYYYFHSLVLGSTYSKAHLDTFYVVGKARCAIGIFFRVFDFVFWLNRILKNNDCAPKTNQKN